MKPLNLELVRAHMERCDWDSLHNSTYSALYQIGRAPMGGIIDQSVLAEVLVRIPRHIRSSAHKWGFSDRVVADNIVRHVRDGVQEAGSFEAWLATAPE